MSYETRPYNQIIQENNLVSYPEPFGIPEKYAEWVKGRGAHMAPVLITRLGELMQNGEDSVLQNSIHTASDFHEVLGLKYEVLDISETKFLKAATDQKKPGIFIYRNSKEIEDTLNNIEGMIIGNPPELNIGKEILHPISYDLSSIEDVKKQTLMEGIPVAAGALCPTLKEAERMAALFTKAGKKYIFKDPGGTDGNGINSNLDDVGSFPVIIEEKLDIDHTMSVQYINGVLGVLREREKSGGDNRWKGNTFPYENGETYYTELFTKQAFTYADKFANVLFDKFGIRPVIFGLDFAVCKDKDGIERMVLLDPNIRMPGNIYLYYQMERLKQFGLEPNFAETALLYEEDVPDMKGKELQLKLDKLGMGLIIYDPEENKPVGFRVDKDGNPEGVLIVVQDPGVNRCNNLSMISVFGKDNERTQKLIKLFSEIK